MKTYTTEQEEFWAGEFGNNYIQRNQDKLLISSNISMFSKVIEKAHNIESIIEFGSNIGLNLIAINQLLPDSKCSAIEINPNAVKELKKLGLDTIFPMSILEFNDKEKRDLVFTKGVLIHINPESLPKVYKRDFAREIMEKYSDLKLVDYGFFYHNDPRHNQEDMTWFLMEKRD